MGTEIIKKWEPDNFELETKDNNISSDAVLFKNMRALEQAVLAECLENKGRFLSFISERIEFFCNLPTWVRPAHDAAFGYAGYYNGPGLIDLFASSVGWRLAVCDSCIGEALDPVLRQR